jgi:hypothetical protein
MAVKREWRSRELELELEEPELEELEVDGRRVGVVDKWHITLLRSRIVLYCHASIICLRLGKLFARETRD